MFKKVNSNEDIVGFYSSGPKIKENDLKISSLFKQFCNFEPVFALIDVRPHIDGLPTTAYIAVEEVVAEGKEIQRVFKHIKCSIEAEEAEEVGVEHLLRDINDPSTSTLALQIKLKLNGLTGFVAKLDEIKVYLQKVINGRIPINNQITYNLQNIFNLIPNLNVDELVKAMLIKTNDMYLVIYVASLVRSVIALHGLLQNKIKYSDIDDILDKRAGVEAAEAKDNDNGIKETKASSPKASSKANSPRSASKK